MKTGELHHSGRCNEFWKIWYLWATGSRPEPVKKKVGMIRDNISGLMAYFTLGITCAMAEYTKSKIYTVQEMPMNKAKKII
jgi:hypothetical protein